MAYLVLLVGVKVGVSHSLGEEVRRLKKIMLTQLVALGTNKSSAKAAFFHLNGVCNASKIYSS